MHHHQYRVFEFLLLSLTLSAGSILCVECPCTAQGQYHEFSITDVPDVHFWTNEEGRPQLDFRAGGPFIGYQGKDPKYLQLPNVWGGGINNGSWRGFNGRFAGHSRFQNNGTMFDIEGLPPPFSGDERAEMAQDDSLAKNGASNIANIETEGTGITWGPVRANASTKSERMLLHRDFKGQSCLLGPVRLTARFIRFDGPVTCIGDDVELVAQRIVINGVDLPPAKWREELMQMRLQAKQAASGQANLNQSVAKY